MNKRKLIPLLSLPFFLYGCSSSFNYVYPDDPSLSYIYRNGDLFLEHASTYEYTTVSINPDNLQSKIDGGEQYLLFLYQDTCMPCQKASPAINGFINESKAKVYSFSNFGDQAEKNKVLSFLSSYGISDVSTPSMFSVYSKYTIQNLSDIASNCDSTNAVWEYLAPKLNITQMYNFSSYLAFETFIKDKDVLTCLIEDDDGQDFFDINIFSLAAHAKKDVCLIDYRNLDQTEKNKFQAGYGNNLVLTTSKGSITSSENHQNNKQKALTLIDNFFK